MARLRGAGRAGGRRLLLAELLPVVLAGVPVGTAVGLGLATVARHTVLDGAAPFELGPGFWLAVAGAALLLTALTWAAAASGTRDGISALLRSVPTRQRGWRLGAVDAVVIAAAGTTVLAFATGSLSGPLAAAAPALLALIAGLLLAYLIVPAATSLGRRLTARGAYAAALALLAVARRPATRRVVTVVTVASALLVFSTYAVSVGSRNRELAAQRDNGAPMVADLTGTNVASAQSALAGGRRARHPGCPADRRQDVPDHAGNVRVPGGRTDLPERPPTGGRSSRTPTASRWPPGRPARSRCGCPTTAGASWG